MKRTPSVSQGLSACAASLLAGLSCSVGAIGGAENEDPYAAENGPQGVECATSRNDEVRLRLATSCQGCHGAGSPMPFFADLLSFEQALVYEPRYVTPGSPDASYLVELLTGTSKTIYKQMPPNGAPFSSMQGTDMSIEDVREWIATLPSAPPELAKPDPDAPTTRRLTAEELVSSLKMQLGLDDSDFVQENGNLNDSALPIWPADGAGIPQSPYGPPSNGWPADRFIALGGPFTMKYQQRERTVTPSMVQVLVEVSQAWCGLSVNKPSSPLFKHAKPSDVSAVSSDAIKKNIAYLHVRMLGEVDPADAIASYEVFLKYEPEGPDIAWTAVCASLVRHPRWVSF